MMLQNVEVLQQAGPMQLLRPLLLDNVPRYVALHLGPVFNVEFVFISSSHFMKPA